MLIAVTSDQWTAGGTLATAVVALVAALFAGWQVWEIRRAREEESRPFVIVGLERSPAADWLFNLVIENTGRSVATEVRIACSPPLESAVPGIDLEETVLLTEGIPMLPPGRRVVALFDSAIERKERDLPLRYDVHVALKDFRGRQQSPQHYIIDLAHLYGLSNVTEYGIHDAAKALQEIQKSVKKWSDTHGRLKVWVRDEDRHSAEQRAHHDLTGCWPSMATSRPPELLVAAGRWALIRTVYRLVRRNLSRLPSWSEPSG